MKLLNSILAFVLFYVVVPAVGIYCGLQFFGSSDNFESVSAFKASVNTQVEPVISQAVKPVVEILKKINSSSPSSDVSAEEQIIVTPNEVAPAPVIASQDPIFQTRAAEAARAEDPNGIALEYVDQSFSADEILSDKLNRLPEDFKVSVAMKKRIHFWFDIYTKYSSRFVVIHDQTRPWIVYRVVDLRPIYESNKHRFVKDHEHRKLVAKNLQEVRHTLVNLSRKKNLSNLSGEEFKFVTLLEEIPGANRAKVIMKCAQKVRGQTGQKDFFRKGLIISSKYLGEMEQIFAHHDLPVELTRLPLVESSFNEDATSKVGASGIWQFMPSTGRIIKLKVTDRIDERNSPIKATVAAARLMLQNFKITKAWPLAITAYNHGPGGVLKAARAVNSRNISDVVDKYESASFSFASQNFYAEYMAALYAEKYQDEIFGRLAKHPAQNGEALDIHRALKVQTLIDAAGLTLEELKLYNPDLKKQTIGLRTVLPAGYQVRLPFGRAARLEALRSPTKETKKKSARSQKTAPKVAKI